MISHSWLPSNLLTKHFLRSLKESGPQHSVDTERNYSGWAGEKLCCQCDDKAGERSVQTSGIKSLSAEDPFLDHPAHGHWRWSMVRNTAKGDWREDLWWAWCWHGAGHSGKSCFCRTSSLQDASDLLIYTSNLLKRKVIHLNVRYCFWLLSKSILIYCWHTDFLVGFWTLYHLNKK